MSLAISTHSEDYMITHFLNIAMSFSDNQNLSKKKQRSVGVLYTRPLCNRQYKNQHLITLSGIKITYQFIQLSTNHGVSKCDKLTQVHVTNKYNTLSNTSYTQVTSRIPARCCSTLRR